jgi:hypothetical protein
VPGKPSVSLPPATTSTALPPAAAHNLNPHSGTRKPPSSPQPGTDPLSLRRVQHSSHPATTLARPPLHHSAFDANRRDALPQLDRFQLSVPPAPPTRSSTTARTLAVDPRHPLPLQGVEPRLSRWIPIEIHSLPNVRRSCLQRDMDPALRCAALPVVLFCPPLSLANPPGAQRRKPSSIPDGWASKLRASQTRTSPT